MIKDELHDRGWILQSMGMVAHPGFVENPNLPPELAVAFLDKGGVLLYGHDIVGVADHVNQGHTGPRERFQRVDGVAAIGQRSRFVLEPVAFQGAAQSPGLPLPLPLPPGQLLKSQTGASP